MTNTSIELTNTSIGFTRGDVAAYLQETFDKLGLVERNSALKALHDKGAPQEMIDLMAARVPPGTRLPDMRALWTYFGDVPIERERS